MSPASTITLAGGARMPVLGLGTWQLTGPDAVEGVSHALEIGYRMIDTSGDYGNQPQIGAVLRTSQVDRGDLFLVSKVEEDEDAFESARGKADELGVERLDLCLLHRPPPDGAGESLWEGLIRARDEGVAREIGVSNYTIEQIDRLIEATGETPAVNQVEWSPFGFSEELLEHATQNGVVIQAYSPLTRGERLDDETLAEIAVGYGKTPAQVMLRWDIEMGTPPVPKAAGREHREENLDVFDFELDEDGMRKLLGLNEHYSSLAGLPYL